MLTLINNQRRHSHPHMQTYVHGTGPVAFSHGLCGSLQGRVSWGSQTGSRTWQAIVVMKLGSIPEGLFWLPPSLNPEQPPQQRLKDSSYQTA